MAVRAADREAVRGLYAFRCGYCGVFETDTGAHLTIDHFQPVAKGGMDAPDNLVYCCHTCNEFKGDWWNPGNERRILHPLNDTLTEHVATGDDGTMSGLTPTGVFHIARLRLNRAPLVTHRAQRRVAARNLARENDAVNRLNRLEAHVERLQNEVEELRGR